MLFPGEGEVTDAAVVLLRKKISGKYTLFKVSYVKSCIPVIPVIPVILNILAILAI